MPNSTSDQTDNAVIAVLRSVSGRHGRVCGHQYIAWRVGCSRRTVIRSIARLLQAGRIAVIKRAGMVGASGHRTDQYVLLDEAKERRQTECLAPMTRRRARILFARATRPIQNVSPKNYPYQPSRQKERLVTVSARDITPPPCPATVERWPSLQLPCCIGRDGRCIDCGQPAYDPHTFDGGAYAGNVNLDTYVPIRDNGSHERRKRRPNHDRPPIA